MIINIKDLINLTGKKQSINELITIMNQLGINLITKNEEQLIIKPPENRLDLLSIEGIARAIKYFKEINKRIINYRALESNYEIIMDNSVKEIKSFAGGIIIKNLKLTKEVKLSLDQLINELNNKLNVFIGLHDLRVIKFPVKYAAIEPESIKFIPLNRDKELTPKQLTENNEELKKLTAYPMLLGADNGVISLPPIAIAELTKIRQNTKELFIEAISNNKEIIKNTLNIIATSLIERNAKISIIKVYEGRNYEQYPDFTKKVLELNAEDYHNITGEQTPTRSMPVLLRRMGVDSSRKKEQLITRIPSYLTNIKKQIDLIELMIIATGYQNIKPEPIKLINYGTSLKLNNKLNYFKDLMIGAGLTEVNNPLICNNETTIKLSNNKFIRENLIQKLIEEKKESFEIGKVIKSDLKQEIRLAILLINKGFMEMKQLLNLFKQRITFKELNNGSLIKGRQAEIILNNQSIGLIGELHPETLLNYGFEKPAVIMELNLEAIT